MSVPTSQPNQGPIQNQGPNPNQGPLPGQGPVPGQQGPRRSVKETKASFKTTEFIFYVVVSIAVLIAAAVTDIREDGQGFGAERAWLFVTLLTIGYMISRGLAKSGSRERYDS